MKCWMVAVRSDNITYRCGYYIDEIVAANVYNYYAKMYHGEYAKLNVVGYVSPEEFIKYVIKKGNNRYHGVSYSKTHKKWIARITIGHRKRFSVGYFNTEIEAIKAYNEKAKELLGDKAKLHIIPEQGEIV